MGRLPNSFREKNRTARQFREQYAKLPVGIRELTKDACLLFDQNPDHPSLRRHILQDNSAGSHLSGSVSVSITMQYRALYVEGDDGINVWYWIGTHAAYNRFTGGK